MAAQGFCYEICIFVLYFPLLQPFYMQNTSFLTSVNLGTNTRYFHWVKRFYKVTDLHDAI